MTISIDGKKYKVNLKITSGNKFPQKFRSKTIMIDAYGKCLIYVTAVGTPEWVDALTVKVPIECFITEVQEPNAEYLKKRRMQKSGLKLVEG